MALIDANCPVRFDKKRPFARTRACISKSALISKSGPVVDKYAPSTPLESLSTPMPVMACTCPG